MKGDKEVIKHLNVILTNEITATNQYFLHARMLKDWGVSVLAEKVYEESIGEMKHADLLIERILFLEGLPNLQDLHRLNIGETVKECLECDMKVETKNQTNLKEAIPVAEAASDFASRDIFAKILTETEEHVDWLETQLGLIEMIGEKAYIQGMMGDAGAGDHAH
ncbi:MAG: bacterioferritin [Alphaproteobacteria bacterium]